MAIQSPITTIDYANTIATSDEWLCALDHKRKTFIQQASIFLVANWYCPSIDFDNPPEEVEYATALIADLIAQGFIYSNEQITPDAKVSSEKTSFGSVSCETSYLGSTKNNRLLQVENVLNDICTRKNGGNSDVFLVRR